MYSAKKIHLDAVFDLYHLLKERKREPNFQHGMKIGSQLSKQVAVYLTSDENYEIIDGHYYTKAEHKFRFDITIIDLNARVYALVLYKKNVEQSDLDLVYDEVLNLKNELVKRTEQKGGKPRPQELYLESGKIETDKAKMRYVQAFLDNKYPNDLLPIYKDMNFKISGHGKYPALVNWKEEAIRLGIEL